MLNDWEKFSWLTVEKRCRFHRLRNVVMLDEILIEKRFRVKCSACRGRCWGRRGHCVRWSSRRESPFPSQRPPPQCCRLKTKIKPKLKIFEVFWGGAWGAPLLLLFPLPVCVYWLSLNIKFYRKIVGYKKVNYYKRFRAFALRRSNK